MELFLIKKGFKKIAIVGGSMGGAAVLNALDIKTDVVIKKVVLLALAGGKRIASKNINKLLIISKNKGCFLVSILYIKNLLTLKN